MQVPVLSLEYEYQAYLKLGRIDKAEILRKWLQGKNETKDINNKELRQELHYKLGATACNWETSSVLKTAQLNGIKSFSFWVITDNADEDMNDDFNANCEKALEIMFPVLNKFIFEGWVNKI